MNRIIMKHVDFKHNRQLACMNIAIKMDINLEHKYFTARPTNSCLTCCRLDLLQKVLIGYSSIFLNETFNNKIFSPKTKFTF